MKNHLKSGNGAFLFLIFLLFIMCWGIYEVVQNTKARHLRNEILHLQESLIIDSYPSDQDYKRLEFLKTKYELLYNQACSNKIMINRYMNGRPLGTYKQ